MIYVFDSNSFSEMSPYFPDIFPAFWTKFETAVANGEISSTREVLLELNDGPQNHIFEWCNTNKSIFETPNNVEMEFVSRIFSIQHFRQLISNKSILRGTPVADPFVIARAASLSGTVVSEESYKPNAAKIPNVCEHFGIRCIKLGEFLREKRWTF
jgi:hypothetical protein